MANERTHYLKHGSASIIVLVLMSIITIYLGIVAKTTGYITDFVAEQERLMRAQATYHALQQYAIAFVKTNYAHLMNDLQHQTHPIALEFAWPPETKQKKRTVNLSVTAAGSIINMDMEYKPYASFTRHLHASLEKIVPEDGTPIFKITSWQPNA